MKTLKTLALATAVSASLLGSIAMAAVNPETPEATSTGKFDITFSNGDQARLWGLDDVNLTTGNHSEIGGTAESMTFCVFSNKSLTGSNLYDLNVSSANGFKMVNAAGGAAVNETAYKLTFTDAKNNTRTAITSDTLIEDLDAGSLSTQPKPNLACPESGDNLTAVAVQFTGTASDVSGIAAGAYYDVITLEVRPQ